MARWGVMTSLAAAALLLCAPRAGAEEFLLKGVQTDARASSINAALQRVPSVKIPSRVVRPEEGDTANLTVFFLAPHNSDVGDLARAIAAATSGGRGAVTVDLAVPAPGLTRENAAGVVEALKPVGGVDARASRADVEKKLIYVRLDARGGARRADIYKALPAYAERR
jgi:hypothetical protein